MAAGPQRRHQTARKIRPLGPLLAALLPLFGVAGCRTVGTSGLQFGRGSLITEQAPSVVYERDAGRVWMHVKETLAHLSERQVRVDEATRTAVATAVNEGIVEVRVEALEPGRSRMLVGARLFSFRSPELAHTVLDQIDRQIEPRRPDY